MFSRLSIGYGLFLLMVMLIGVACNSEPAPTATSPTIPPPPSPPQPTQLIIGDRQQLVLEMVLVCEDIYGSVRCETWAWQTVGQYSGIVTECIQEWGYLGGYSLNDTKAHTDIADCLIEHGVPMLW